MEQGIEFNPETVLQQYSILSSGKSRDERTKANQYILRFIQSDSAWLIAEKLLLPDQAPETQFIGAQALYQKLQNDFDKFQKDEQIKLLRDNLFKMLQSIDFSKSKIVVERLCMCIAYIAIRTCNTFWEDSIVNVISFGTADQKQCFLSLKIFKHIAMIFEQQQFDKRTSTIIETFLRNNLSQVLEFLNQIMINPQSVAEECYNEAFSTAKYWCEYSTKTFIPNEGFITSLFNVLNQGTQQAMKVFKILRKLLYKSKYAKLLDNTSFDQAFLAIPEKDQQFLQLIVQYLSNNRQNFIKAANESIEDEDAQHYAMKFSSILIAITGNYEILLIRESETSSMLFQLLLDIASQKNLKISLQTLEFWDEFKETITEYIEDLNQREFLFKPYIEMFKILLQQCKKSSTHAKTSEDQEELDQEERGMSVVKYRDFASDVFFKAYLLIKRVFKDQGQHLIFNIIIEGLKNQADPMLFESSIFATKSLIDAMTKSQIDLEFLKVVFESIINQNPNYHQNYQISRGCISFIHEAAQYLQAFPQFIKGTLDLLIFYSIQHQDLHELIYKTIFEICQQCKHQFGDIEFQTLYNHLEQNYKTMKQDHVGTLMEGVSTVCAELPSDKLGLAVQQTLSIALNYFKFLDLNQIQVIDRFELAKSLSMLSGCIKALENIDQEVLYQTLLPIIQNIWPILCRILEVKYMDQEIILFVCNLIQRLLSALKIKLKDIFPSLAKSLIFCFQQQPENNKCLKVFSLSCSVLGHDPDVLISIEQLYDEICSIIMVNVYREGKISLEFLNTDIVRCLSELMHKISELNINILKNSKYFNDIILLFHETLVNVNEKETNNQLVLFFSYLISSRHAQDIVDKYLDYITVALMCSIHKEQGPLLEKISNALVVLMNNAEQSGQEQRLTQIMSLALQKPAFIGLSERMKALFINILFALKGQRPKIRLALINFNGLVNGIVGEDSFIGLEIEAQNALKVKQAQLQGLASVITLD